MTVDAIAGLDHRRLRSAIEFALAVAAEGQKVKPPLAFPAAFKPFLRQQRVPTAALGKLRRAIEADEAFRKRLAASAVPELVDPIGLEWLRREEGWQERIAALVAASEEAEARADMEAALRRAERRREAAEQAAVRTRAELVSLLGRVDTLEEELAAARAERRELQAELERARAALAEARREARHANDRAEAARHRLAGVEAERDDAARRAAAAEAQRDALLVDRAERGGVGVSAQQVVELRELARSARGLADRLASLIEVGAAGRVPLPLPGAVAGDPARAAEHLLRSAGVLVLVDGYNVAKLAWPDDSLARQRERCLDLVDDLARRFGTDFTVVFDGADVIGAHTTKRRLARVVYSPAGTTADDVIRAEVGATPADRPVVVVTNDQAVRRDVAAAGANWVSSDAFLAVAR
jgi:hypothetical protein